MKKVSVIVPVYNVEDQIANCIKTILQQTYENLELILIDDNSSDKSGQICNKYSTDSRVKVIHNIKNYGVSYARNEGLKLASGDYIAFCDADDYYSENYVESMLATALKQNADITICGYYIKTNNALTSSVVTTSRYVVKDEIIKHIALDNEFGGFCWNKLFKRTVLKNKEFPVTLDILEDTYFLCDVLQNECKVYYLAEALYYYCYRSTSAVNNLEGLYTSQNTIKYLDSWKKILTDFSFTDKEKNMIYVAMFKIAVSFKYKLIFQKQHINKQVLYNLDLNIKDLKPFFYKEKNVSTKHKIKITLLLIMLNLCTLFK